MTSFYSPQSHRQASSSDTGLAVVERNSPSTSSPPFLTVEQVIARLGHSSKATAKGAAADSCPADADQDAEWKQLQNRTRKYAFDLLARREYAESELREKLLNKLSAKNPDYSKRQLQDCIELVVLRIKTEGLQSDKRYVDMLIRGRIHQGHGPLRISQELKHKQVDDVDYMACLDMQGEEWMARARQVREKKFGKALPADARQRAKQMRFLQYRGFSGDQIRYALSCA